MDYRALAAQAAQQNGVPVDLFLKLINQESRFRPDARSPVGAIGLAQLMPGTAKDLGVNPHDPVQNLNGGARYLRQQLDTFKDPRLALAAYNAGPGNVRKHGGVPPFKETQNYVQTIMGASTPPFVAANSPQAQPRPAGQPAPATTTTSTTGSLDPMGILDFFMNGGGQQQPEEPQGFFNRDRMDRLAIGLEGMTLNPNQQRMELLSDGIKQRGADRKQAGVTNKTVELLMSKRPDLAALVQAGAIQPSEAIKIMMTPAETTAMQQNVEYLMKNHNMTAEQALAAVSSAAGSSKNYGTIPAGYQVVEGRDENGNPVTRMEPIPGSPAAAEAGEAERANQNRTATTEKYRSEVVRAAESAVEMLGTNGGMDVMPDAGIWGDRMARWGINQEAVNIKNALATVKSGVAFDRLQEMREASKTGGALGSVSAPELELLMASLGSIDQSNDPAILKANLTHIATILTKIENDPVAGAIYRGGTPPAGGAAPAPAGQAPSSGQQGGGTINIGGKQVRWGY